MLALVIRCRNALCEIGIDDTDFAEAVHKNLLDAIARSIRHRALDFDDESVIAIAIAALKHDRRPVRLAAGCVMTLSIFCCNLCGAVAS